MFFTERLVIEGIGQRCPGKVEGGCRLGNKGTSNICFWGAFNALDRQGWSVLLMHRRSPAIEATLNLLLPCLVCFCASLLSWRHHPLGSGREASLHSPLRYNCQQGGQFVPTGVVITEARNLSPEDWIKTNLLISHRPFKSK